MKYSAIIFDMDGTIVDTKTIWIEATCQLYSQEISYIDGFTDFITHVKQQFTNDIAVATNANNNTRRKPVKMHRH